ncbi:MAG: hypothetical protein ACLPX9_21530 [Rhodomicrobium sp.]
MFAKIKSGYGVAALAFAAGWALFALPWLSGDVTVPWDAKAHFLPQLQFLAHALHTGQSPAWNHNVFGGSPQIADPQSLIFSPAILLAYLEPNPSFRELDLYCFLLLAAAGFAVLMFFRDRGWHPAGAIVAALATALGGSSIWRIQHIKQIETFAFFMLTLWLLARALERRTLLSGALAGLAAAMMIVEPGQVALIGIYVLLGYTLNYWLSQPRFWASVRQTLPALVSGGIVASILAAGPILLSLLFILDSNRPEIPYKEAARGALHPASLLTAAIANLYSVLPDLPYWGPASIWWPADWLQLNENMGQVYIGVLPVLLLLAVGVMRGKLWLREIRFFSLAIAALLFYALGRYTIVFHWLYDYLPGVDMFRRPADATYALGPMTAIASGYFLHLLLTKNERPSEAQSYGVLGILAAVFLTALGVAAAHDHLFWAMKPILISAALFAGGWLALQFSSEYSQRYAGLTVAGLAAFMTADLAIGNAPNRSTAKPPSQYEEMRADTKNDTIAFLRAHLGRPENSPWRDRVELVGLGFEWPNIGLIHNFDHVLGYNPVRLGEIVQAMGAAESVAEAKQRVFTPLFPSYRSTMADLLGLRYIVIDRPVETFDRKLRLGDLKLVAHTSNGYIYENPRALPRVMFATGSMLSNFDKLVSDGRWPNFDPTETVLLNGTPPQTPAMQGVHVSLTKAAIALTAYQNTEVQVEVDSPKAGFVVLNDVWHPWWFGSIDGKPAEILRANVLFRAIQVPAGKHTVRFEFRPVEGAIKEIAARISGKPPLQPGPELPGEPVRPEARAPEQMRLAGGRTGILR